ncbi:hypothetical protein WICPIJ_001700 [Wickerhamomyces pijperi]|uniref:TRAM domain-containing protein n=1 Tax=Wickerhamomyces pijperi TaxID=599730 RepID=A0A9P8QAB7_WICPI|nr:hypothetical protein WICPIJ_001700 [Wickerhamomyces pijperi]
MFNRGLVNVNVRRSSQLIRLASTSSSRPYNRAIDPTSSEGSLLHELKLLSSQPDANVIPVSKELRDYYRQRQNFREVERVSIIKLSVTGNGIALVKSEENDQGSIFVSVPFTLPGDIVDLKIGIHHEAYAEGHLVRVVSPSHLRDDKLIGCKYFNSCSGCQLQMLSYEKQVDFKTNTVKDAFAQFGFDINRLPILETVKSPLQYNYRTKLTPHFNSNRKYLKLGFEGVFDGRKRLFDLESCDIATPVLNKALVEDREVLLNKVREYKRSGTILLRDTTLPSDETPSYTIDHRRIIKQEVGGFQFEFPAGEFFQNNPSILPELVSTISSHIVPSKHKTLVDTYCGSGFLGISLSGKVESLIGIEISKGNLTFASHNAKVNNISNATFHLGSSEDIFESLDATDIDNKETVVILDPSRKGSTESYLSQLSQFEPDLVVYLSCNVFSQARDLDYFLNKTENGQKYEITTVQGWDFFPQTKHVESLAILKHKGS